MTRRSLFLAFVYLWLSAPLAYADGTIIVLGDSLSSGYGLGAEHSWVDLLETRLASQAYGYQVVNASVPGDTSAGGLARLPRLLQEHAPGIVVIEMGGNDGLRGQPVDGLKGNLQAMIELVLEHGGQPLLTGIQIPPNYGPRYTEAFTGVYFELSEQFDIPIVEFLMDGVALDPNLMQSDGMHPNAAGQTPMLENVWHVLSTLL